MSHVRVSSTIIAGNLRKQEKIVVGQAQVELNQHDLPHFVAFVLLDEASRVRSGKRQSGMMKGYWMAGQMKGGLRLSDRRFRDSVCMEALRSVGEMPVAKAAAYVASVLGKRGAAEVDVLRVAYYECRPGRLSWNLFFPQFLHWRAWVFQSGQGVLDRMLEDYGRRFGALRRQSLAELIERLRSDRVQRARNRCWLLEPGQEERMRIESNHWDAETEWEMLATDLWSLGRLHARIGDLGEAKALLARALELWKTHGHEVAHVQEQAIPALEAEIAQLVVDEAPSPSA